jgi:GTPase SAR1 family protein
MNEQSLTLPGIDSDASTETLRARLVADVEAAAALPGIDATALDALRAKLAGRIFNLVVAGEFKRGKSSVVNALLGADVLPTGVVPLTSIVTALRHGRVPSVEVMFEDGREGTFALDALPGYVTERGNPKNSKHVRTVEVTFPAPWLGRGFRLVDTPGIGSAYSHNTDMTRAFLPQADAVIFVASVEQPVSRAELQFLADIRAHADRIFCLLNKTDYLSPAELAESVAFSTAALREALGAEVPVFPVSARHALEARAAHAGDAFAASGFAAFDAALRGFLERDSGAVWIDSVRRHLTRLLSECKLSAELELKALAAPLATLDENLRAFAARRDETLRARDDFDALLTADLRKLVKERVEPDIVAFKRELRLRLGAAVPDWLGEAETQHEMPRQTALEQRIVEETRRAFDDWRAREDDAINDDFERICDRFRSHIRQQADALLHYSAELFSIRFEAVDAAPLRQARSRFYYKFWQEPPSMRLMSDAVAGLLPGALGHAVLQKRARRRVAELVEMQSGRLRHDFEQRIMEAMREARRELFERMDTTIASIGHAIDKGRALRTSGGDAADVRRREIEAQIARIEAIASRRLALSVPG